MHESLGCAGLARFRPVSVALRASGYWGRRSDSRGRRAEHLDVEVADFFTQRVAVEPEQRGSPDLIATRGGQGCHQQGPLNVLQNAVIEPRRRQFAPVAGEVPGQVALDLF